MGWKSLLREKDPELYLELIELIKETEKYKDIILQAPDPSKAQIWVALALLSKKLNEKRKKEKKSENIDVKEIAKTF